MNDRRRALGGVVVVSLLIATVMAMRGVSVSASSTILDGSGGAAAPPAAISGSQDQPATTGGGTDPGGASLWREPDAGDQRDRSLEPDLVLLGSWTVRYVVGPENGHGANIEIPLRRLDGLLLRPGVTFDFWRAIGTVSRKTGYRTGAVIGGDHVVPDGALAGGICTVSTALFNAAARSGLEILSRTSHGGYIARYPLGLDAAVAKSDTWVQTVAFRNDTTQPILLRTVGTAGIARVDLYAAAPLDRSVVFGLPVISNRQRAHDRHVRSGALHRGETRRVEVSSDGMTVRVERTVHDARGRVIHHDRWVSRYRPLRGLVLDGTG